MTAEREFLFFQFEPDPKCPTRPVVDVRCEKHLPKKARVVDTEEDRRRFVKSWLKANNYHEDHRCMTCNPTVRQRWNKR